MEINKGFPKGRSLFLFIMGLININNEIYGSNKSEDIIYNDITVKEKLDTIPIFDINDNSNVTNEINDNLTYSHIYDGLTSEENNKVLSANQGRILNEKIDSSSNILENKIKENTNNISILNTKADDNYNFLSNAIENNYNSLSSDITNLSTEVDEKLSKTGDSMTGMLYLNTGGVAIGSKEVSQCTLTDLVNTLRYQNGGMGSVNLTAAHSPIAAGWWNYIYVPHRMGGSGGDNFNYGNLILIGMTQSIGTMYTVTIGGGTIKNITAH